MTQIEKESVPEVAVFNLGAQIGDRNLQATSYKALKWGGGLLALVFLDWLLLLLKNGRAKGTILVTSATAAVQGIRVSILMRQRWVVGACYASL